MSERIRVILNQNGERMDVQAELNGDTVTLTSDGHIIGRIKRNSDGSYLPFGETSLSRDDVGEITKQIDAYLSL